VSGVTRWTQEEAEVNFKTRHFMDCNPRQIIYNDLIEEDEMGAACGMHARRDKYVKVLYSNHEGKNFLRRL
jgi:hypothetical protein